MTPKCTLASGPDPAESGLGLHAAPALMSCVPGGKSRCLSMVSQSRLLGNGDGNRGQPTVFS